jgi:hypothetical protein
VVDENELTVVVGKQFRLVHDLSLSLSISL